LKSWLKEVEFNLPKGRYGADFGFSLKRDALGCDAVLTPEIMGEMSSGGMALFLSEYPCE
jgi:hypothetical protein